MTDGLKIDLHMHSTVSDGTDSPEELLSRVKEECKNKYPQYSYNRSCNSFFVHLASVFNTLGVLKRN